MLMFLVFVLLVVALVFFVEGIYRFLRGETYQGVLCILMVFAITACNGLLLDLIPNAPGK